VAGRTLTVRDLNRATLARQLLLRRRRLSILAALERLAGLQAQWAPAPYIGLWTRVEGFRREALERALLGEQAVRAVLMRGTVHLVSRRDYGVFGSAVALPAWVSPESARIADAVHDSLLEFGREPRTRAEILAWLGETHGIEHDGGAGLWYALRAVGRITHAPASGTWKQPRETRYVLIDHEQVDPLPARESLVRRYLGAFGPATRADIAEWSGLRVRDFEPALESLGPLRTFRDERGRELLDLPRAPLPPGDSPAPVRFLPRYDNLVLAHADRARVVADEHRRTVIHGGGMVEATFLVDGFVAGLWRAEAGRVRVEPFAPLPRVWRREVEDEAARLEAWLR
ncbi:MAG TPA: winged helix DNA-binding domain-containing protein, partial [Gaiellaceae bacterium]|nr:winged helix DNA-binding domain-containing protein [Gaiellaceae bacterium]